MILTFRDHFSNSLISPLLLKHSIMLYAIDIMISLTSIDAPFYLRCFSHINWFLFFLYCSFNLKKSKKKDEFAIILTSHFILHLWHKKDKYTLLSSNRNVNPILLSFLINGREKPWSVTVGVLPAMVSHIHTCHTFGWEQ